MILLSQLSGIIRPIYQHTNIHGVDIEKTWDAIKNIKGSIILFFDSSSEHFYAINEIANRANTHKTNIKVLFIIEEREKYYQRNRHHLSRFSNGEIFVFNVPKLTHENSNKLYDSLFNVGLIGEKFRAQSKEQVVNKIIDIEKGYRGDLLATMCDIVGNKPYIEQLNDEYNDIEDEAALEIFCYISIVTSARLQMPVLYLSEILGMNAVVIYEKLQNELNGKIYFDKTNKLVSTRHHVIADYHIKNLLTLEHKQKIVINLMRCLSTKFTISDIKRHPLPYRIYREVLSHYFLMEVLFTENSEFVDFVYDSCQRFFPNDGMFWLQYGRYLHKVGRLDDALHCLKKGYGLFDSFQTRHALGHIYLDFYVATNCLIKEYYDNGLFFLSDLIKSSDDPYAHNTLIDCLNTILQFKYDKLIEIALKDAINAALINHRDDPVLQSVISKCYANKKLNLLL